LFPIYFLVLIRVLQRDDWGHHGFPAALVSAAMRLRMPRHPDMLRAS